MVGQRELGEDPDGKINLGILEIQVRNFRFCHWDLTTMVRLEYRHYLLTGTVILLSLGTTACIQNPFAQPKPKPSPVAQSNQPNAAKTTSPKATTSNSQTPTKASSKPPAKAAVKPTDKAVAQAPTGKPSESFQLALDRADSARSIGQSAANTDDWKLAASRWEQAIEHLKEIPKNDPNHKLVAGKLTEFAQGLETAERKSQGLKVQGRLEPAVFAEKRRDPDEVGGADSSRSFSAPIKYRQSRIPVVDVVFNNGAVYEMLVDTGASGTMITYEMANSLGLRELGQVNVGTAAGDTTMSVAKINAMTVAGKTIYNVPVTVGPVGLLGHDFFGDCDVTIRRDVVEFAGCSV
jgi:hypothetical protein